MRVKFIGTGQMATKRKCTSFVVNNNVLFDIGNGVVDGLLANNLDVENIKVIVISHFHTDHFGDIVYFLHRRNLQGHTDKMLTIIGPWGLQQKVIDFNNFLFGDVRDYKDIATKWNIRFIELADGANLNMGSFEIEVFKVAHSTVHANGYIIRAGKTSIGYSGDAAMTDAFLEKIPDAKYWIIDANDILRAEGFHIGFTELIGIAATHKDRVFYAVHRKDYDISSSTEINLFCPLDNEEFVAN